MCTLIQACFLHTFPAICATGVAGNLSFGKIGLSFEKKIGLSFEVFSLSFFKFANKQVLIWLVLIMTCEKFPNSIKPMPGVAGNLSFGEKN